MNKVYQKQFYIKDKQNGDCLRACLETITGIALPIFPKISVYITILKHHGWNIEADEQLEYLEFRNNENEEFYISIGDGGRGTLHATIIDKKGNLLHDPYHNGTGNLNTKEVIVLYKIDKKI